MDLCKWHEQFASKVSFDISSVAQSFLRRTSNANNICTGASRTTLMHSAGLMGQI